MHENICGPLESCNGYQPAKENSHETNRVGDLEGDTVTYECDANHKWSDGNTSSKQVTCGSDSQWSQFSETCRGVLIVNYVLIDLD